MRLWRTGYVAKQLNISTITVFRWIHQAKIRAKKDAMEELVENVISTVTIFSAKLYSLRSQKFRSIAGVLKSALHG